MSRGKVLEVVSGRNPLRFCGTEEVVHHWICIVSERNFDGTVKAV